MLRRGNEVSFGLVFSSWSSGSDAQRHRGPLISSHAWRLPEAVTVFGRDVTRPGRCWCESGSGGIVGRWRVGDSCEMQIEMEMEGRISAEGPSARLGLLMPMPMREGAVDAVSTRVDVAVAGGVPLVLSRLAFFCSFEPVQPASPALATS